MENNSGSQQPQLQQQQQQQSSNTQQDSKFNLTLQLPITDSDFRFQQDPQHTATAATEANTSPTAQLAE
jgi:hypothetical protein